MKLNDAMQLSKLQGVVPKNYRSATEIANRVFELSARIGEPYEKMTADQWKKTWLESDKFVLAEIGVEQVAIPLAKKINPEKVRRTMSACADGQLEPIVVDLNRQQIGKTPLGFTPKVIVVDGKHRHRAQVEMGKDRVLAWVGIKAMAELEQRKNGGKRFVIEAAASQKFSERQIKSNLETTAILHAALAIKPSSAITRQDTGDGGSRPTGGTQVKKWEAAGAGGAGGMGGSLGGGSGSNPNRMGVYGHGTSEGVEKEWDSRGRGKKEEREPLVGKVRPFDDVAKKAIKEGRLFNPDKEREIIRKIQESLRGQSQDVIPGARSSGTLEDPDPSDTKVTPDPSDSKTFVDPSDRQNWNPDKPQLCAPGCTKDHKHKFSKGGNPTYDSPGSGVGPRLNPDWGSKNSEFSEGMKAKASKMSAGPVKVKKIVTKKRKLKAHGGGGHGGHGGPGMENPVSPEMRKHMSGDQLLAVSPPGFKYTVEKMKQDHSSEISNPFALSWWMKNKGYKSHVHKPPKRTKK